jgi:hypothetical protein
MKIAIVTSILIFLASYSKIASKIKYNRFQKHMKVGDKCLFKSMDIWHPAKITAIFNYTIIIEDEDGDAHAINKPEIRPYSKIR